MRLIFGSIALLASVCARGAEPDSLVTRKAGQLPIILSAPHGGRAAIPGVPPRRGHLVPQFTTERDDNTAELTELVATELQQRLKARPFLVIARFERKYADANRPESAGLESEKARPAYRAYHTALEEFARAVQKTWKRGLLLDIHGQGGIPDALARGTNNGQTVELLVQRYGKSALIGPRSLCGLFAATGHKVVPEVNSSAAEDKRYVGGHTVRTYGSHQGHGIDAIQLEFGTELRAKTRLPKTASTVAEAIERFCREYLPEAIR